MSLIEIIILSFLKFVCKGTNSGAGKIMFATDCFDSGYRCVRSPPVGGVVERDHFHHLAQTVENAAAVDLFERGAGQIGGDHGEQLAVVAFAEQVCERGVDHAEADHLGGFGAEIVDGEHRFAEERPVVGFGGIVAGGGACYLLGRYYPDRASAGVAESLFGQVFDQAGYGPHQCGLAVAAQSHEQQAAFAFRVDEPAGGLHDMAAGIVVEVEDAVAVGHFGVHGRVDGVGGMVGRQFEAKALRCNLLRVQLSAQCSDVGKIDRFVRFHSRWWFDGLLCGGWLWMRPAGAGST